MNQVESSRLLHRRQYLLCPTTIECPFEHNVVHLSSEYHLYIHPDLPLSQFSQGNLQLVLLGDLFDYRNTRSDNNEILSTLNETHFNDLLKQLAYYAGRYVLFFVSGVDIMVVHDLVAARKVFYTQSEKGVWLGSLPELVASVMGIQTSKDQSKVEFYGSAEFSRLCNSNIGNTTFWEEIYQLLPNHYFDIRKGEPVRYWPRGKLTYLPVDQVAQVCSSILQGVTESIANRYDIMVPVTGGKDSRTIMAATKRISHKVYYYINKGDDLDSHSNDIRVPQRLLSSLGLKFNIVDPYDLKIDKDFQKIFRQNLMWPIDDFLPHIYTYYRKFSNKVNLPGVFVGSVYEMYGTYDKIISADMLARLNKVTKYPHAVKYYEEWIRINKPLCKEFNINLFILFYWEERLANWGTQIQLNKDMAQEDFVPFNSRRFIEQFLSVHPRYNSKPRYILYKKIIQRLWPEALNQPFNPSVKHRLISLLDFFGGLNPNPKTAINMDLQMAVDSDMSSSEKDFRLKNETSLRNLSMAFIPVFACESLDTISQNYHSAST